MRYGRLQGENMPNYKGVRDGVLILGPTLLYQYWVHSQHGPFIVGHKPKRMNARGKREVIIVRDGGDNARVFDHLELGAKEAPEDILTLADQAAKKYFEDLQ